LARCLLRRKYQSEKANTPSALFAIDEKLNIKGGFNYTLRQIEQKHQQKSSDGCSGGGAGGSDTSHVGFACTGGGLIGMDVAVVEAPETRHASRTTVFCEA